MLITARAGLFEKHGFTPLDVIRPAVWENDAVERWYRQNAIIYCRNDVVAEYAPRCVGRPFPLSIVHPKQYVEIATRLANDRDRRSEVEETILAKNWVLFENSAGVNELADFIASIRRG